MEVYFYVWGFEGIWGISTLGLNEKNRLKIRNEWDSRKLYRMLELRKKIGKEREYYIELLN